MSPEDICQDIESTFLLGGAGIAVNTGIILILDYVLVVYSVIQLPWLSTYLETTYEGLGRGL
jgi:hypothetical protein